MIHFDNVTKTLTTSESRSGLSGYISFHRLESVLRDAGELAKNEKLIQFDINNFGIRFTVEMKNG